MNKDDSAPIKTVRSKYIFTDIVSFTKDRSVEAQSDLVSYLNSIVEQALKECSVEKNARILLPTGDGICVGIIDSSLPFDVHLQFARSLLIHLEEHNGRTEDPMRKFELRVGLNENVDNLVTDVNGRTNLAGAGINMAQRIMDKADGNQILLGQAVYETLHAREAYLGSFKQFSGLAKHKLAFSVFQYLESDASWLNSQTPSMFAKKEEPPTTLTRLAAYYLALALKHEDFLLARRDDASFDYNATVWLYTLAKDYHERSQASRFDNWRPHVEGGLEGSPEEQYAYYDGQNFWVMVELADLLSTVHLAKFRPCFEGMACIFVNKDGRNKLHAEWPDIEKEING